MKFWSNSFHSYLTKFMNVSKEHMKLFEFITKTLRMIVHIFDQRCKNLAVSHHLKKKMWELLISFICLPSPVCKIFGCLQLHQTGHHLFYFLLVQLIYCLRDLILMAVVILLNRQWIFLRLSWIFRNNFESAFKFLVDKIIKG